MNYVIRQFHRWISIVFTLTVIVNIVWRIGHHEPPMWVTYSPLPFLFLLLFSGLYMFALPYFGRGRAARAAD
jgi:hypothetical protein